MGFQLQQTGRCWHLSLGQRTREEEWVWIQFEKQCGFLCVKVRGGHKHIRIQSAGLEVQVGNHQQQLVQIHNSKSQMLWKLKIFCLEVSCKCICKQSLTNWFKLSLLTPGVWLFIPVAVEMLMYSIMGYCLNPAVGIGNSICKCLRFLKSKEKI